jgi:outer membrane immunogenic protein
MGNRALKSQVGQGTVVKLIASGVAAIAALFGTVAFAADAVFPPPSLPPQGWSFTGCYIGANAGAGWGNSNFNWTNINQSSAAFSTGAATVLPQAADASLDRAGFIGGGQAGCNYQPGWLVVGIEGDFDYMGLSVGQDAVSLGNTNGGPSTIVPGNIGESFSTDWLSTVRARLGIATGAWFYYATGGLAIAQASFSDRLCFPAAGTPTCNAASSSGTHEGWVAGAGIEWKLAPAWSTKFEFLYADLGTTSYDSTATIATTGGAANFPNATITHTHSFNEDIIRIGVNYQFAWGTQ